MCDVAYRGSHDIGGKPLPGLPSFVDAKPKSMMSRLKKKAEDIKTNIKDNIAAKREASAVAATTTSSTSSTVASASPAPSNEPPSTPERLCVVSTTSKSVTLQWKPCKTKASNSTVTYRVEFDDGTGWAEVEANIVVDASKITAVVNGLGPSCSYTCRAVAMTTVDAFSKPLQFVTAGMLYV